jgi:UDP-glucose:(heptosyl)LPS alpha-1,3-glucosyltransferase
MVREEIRRGFRIEPEKLHVIYNGIDLEQFHPRLRARLRDVTRAELACGPDETLFLFVGSGFARKGLDAAIQALAQARNRSFRLVVAGRDREENFYRDLSAKAGIGDRVRFLGGREDVRPLYAAADCFILPSRYDPFPNTGLEALAMGLPSIVSSSCGAAEVVEHGKSGWVCRADDAPGIARLMLEAASAVRGGNGGFDHWGAARATAERFGMDAMAAKLTELYGTLNS